MNRKIDQFVSDLLYFTIGYTKIYFKNKLWLKTYINNMKSNNIIRLKNIINVISYYNYL